MPHHLIHSLPDKVYTSPAGRLLIEGQAQIRQRDSCRIKGGGLVTYVDDYGIPPLLQRNLDLPRQAMVAVNHNVSNGLIHSQTKVKKGFGRHAPRLRRLLDKTAHLWQIF